MIRLAILAALLAGPVAAQQYPAETHLGGDTFRLEAAEADRVVLHYTNNANQSSRHGTVYLALGTVVVAVTVTVGDGELIEVFPISDHVAIPPEITVQDGQDGAVLIVLPMF